MKKIYVVRGSEDGNIGVYSNMKLAYNKASSYVKNSCEPDTKILSYSQVCSEFRSVDSVSLHDESGINAEIELFGLNQ